MRDGLEPIPDYPSPLLNFKTGLALVVSLYYDYYDYHGYRLDENGMWTHKPGGTNATNLDNSGNVITDPRTAVSTRSSAGSSGCGQISLRATATRASTGC